MIYKETNQDQIVSVNKAAHIIKKSGDMIENVVEVGVEVISSIFKAVIE